jgi:hypothetical protein
MTSLRPVRNRRSQALAQRLAIGHRCLRHRDELRRGGVACDLGDAPRSLGKGSGRARQLEHHVLEAAPLGIDRRVPAHDAREFVEAFPT